MDVESLVGDGWMWESHGGEGDGSESHVVVEVIGCGIPCW